MVDVADNNAAALPVDPVVVADADAVVGGMDLPATGSTDALLVVDVVVASDPPETPIL